MELKTLIGRAVVAQAQYTELYIAHANETDQMKAAGIEIRCNAHCIAAQMAWMDVALQVLREGGVRATETKTIDPTTFTLSNKGFSGP